MEILGLLLGALGIVVSVGIAIWQHRKAAAAEKHLAHVMSSLPDVLLAGFAKALASPSQHSEAAPAGEAPYPGFSTSYADIDGDGKPELLVQMPTGAYGSVLLVYGMKDWEFQKIGELYSTTIGGFEVADIDGDGQLEVRTDEIAERPGLPYVAGLRDQVTHRFDNGKFVQINRVEHWTEEEMRRLKTEFGQQPTTSS